MPSRPRISVQTAIVLVLAFGTLVVWSGQAARACDFDEPPPERVFDEATAVFAGEVVAIVPVEDDPASDYLAVTFEVDRVWKGVSQSPLTVETHRDEATCGYPFQEGERYLVYAHGGIDELFTALFHRTTAWESTDTDLNALGEGSPVEQVATDEPAPDQEDTGVSSVIFIIVLILISILVATVMVIRRVRREAEQEEIE
jgi:hypothetical protein